MASQVDPTDELFDLLMSGGGPEVVSAEENQPFLQRLNELFPELQLYCEGEVQSSPGFQDPPGSLLEYYRSVGALMALISAFKMRTAMETGDEDLKQKCLDLVSAGPKGPMSMDKIPGKFINIGTKPEVYANFCKSFNDLFSDGQSRYAFYVLLAMHDTGKCDLFREKVNALLQPTAKTDDHDRILAAALMLPQITSAHLPRFHALPTHLKDRIRQGFSTHFHLPQLIQGEISPIDMQGLVEVDSKTYTNGSLLQYCYYAIFDIAGGSCNRSNIYPTALIPVYGGYMTASHALVDDLKSKVSNHLDLYYNFLRVGFCNKYTDFQPQPVKDSFDRLLFVTMRIMAMTRNSYTNPQALYKLIQEPQHAQLVAEMCGDIQPQVMLYYSPDMIRMGASPQAQMGPDPEATQVAPVLEILGALHARTRQLLKDRSGAYQFELNVSPIVKVIRDQGKEWKGAQEFKHILQRLESIECNMYLTEGMVALAKPS